MLLCDTNIFIEVYRRNTTISAELEKIGHENIAIIAATAIYYHIELFTLNVKDFKFIPNIKLYKI